MSKNYFTIGITGGIGSGKSLIASILQKLQYPVFYADAEAKKLIAHNIELKKAIINLFGSECYAENGELNRKYLANIVFNNPDKLKQLNAIVHPATEITFQQWAVNQYNTTKKTLLFKEAAILFEAKATHTVDFIVMVYAPLEIRIQRTMQRDGVLRENVLKRIEQQWSDEYKKEHSHFVVYNDGTQLIIPQVLEMVNFFKEKVL